MKKIITSFLLCLVAIVTTAQHKFPEVKAQRPLATAPAKVAAQPVPEVGEGKTIYCGVQLDLLRRSAGLATFDLSDPMNSLSILNNRALAWIDDADYESPIAGAYAKGKYYSFIGKVYSFVTERRYWGTFDLETGNFNKIADAQPSPTFNNDAMYANYSPVYSMSYDAKHDRMYALYYDVATYTGGFLNCVLATVDLETGVLTKVGEFDKIYYSIAIDHFGKMYGITYKLDSDGENIVGTNLYRINDDDGNVDVDDKGFIYEEALVGEVKSSDGDSFAGGTLQDMEFDNDSYVIRWNRINSNGTYICELDPETAVYSHSQLIGSNATVVGIYAPYTPADSPEAPGHVTDLTATAGSQGAPTVTLSWTNPTITWNHHELEAVTEVHIYRGEELIGIVTDGVAKGSQSTFTDTEAAMGFTTYKVVACRNEDEEGLPTSVVAYVGYDAPGAPQNVVLTSVDGYDGVITWDAPAEGKNGGWYDPATLTYTITRLPDNKVVAKDISETTFTDNTLTTTKSYSYTVQANNAAGAGLSTTSNEMILGPAIVPPYSASFTDNDAASLWTPLDANADGDGWRFEDFWNAWISTNYGNAGNDWLFSPDFAFEEGHSYRVSFGLYKPYHSSGGKEYITFAYGKGANVEAMNTLAEMVEIANNETRYYSYTLTADKSGKYNIALNARGESSNWGTYFTAISVNEVNANDLAATAITGPSEVSATATNIYTVTVANKGAVAAAAYAVQLVDDDDNVLGETAVTTALVPQNETDVKVTWTPDAALANTEVEVYGRVIFDGDGDASNDNTDEPLRVHVGEVSNYAWVDYDGKEGWTDATTDNMLVPFGFSFKSTWSEVIYDVNDMRMPEGDVTISKISYDYNFGTAVEAKIKVYIGTTDKTSFSNTSEIMGIKDLTLVSDSTFDMARGSGNLIIHFTRPYVVKAGQNIVIAVDRPYASYNDADVFDNHFVTLDSKPLQTTLQYGNDNTSFDWTGETNTYTSTWIPVTHFYVADGATGVESVYSNQPEGQSIYTLSGVRVCDTNSRGTYIIREGGKARKVVR